MSDNELIHALRNNVGVSEAACRAANKAADRIEELKAKVRELEEYKWMYEELCK